MSSILKPAFLNPKSEAVVPCSAERLNHVGKLSSRLTAAYRLSRQANTINRDRDDFEFVIAGFKV